MDFQTKRYIVKHLQELKELQDYVEVVYTEDLYINKKLKKLNNESRYRISGRSTFRGQ